MAHTHAVSHIGPTEHVRRGQLLKAVYDPAFDEFCLAIWPINGGRPRLAPCWTCLFREQPSTTKTALLRLGAQLCLGSLELVS